MEALETVAVFLFAMSEYVHERGGNKWVEKTGAQRGHWVGWKSFDVHSIPSQHWINIMLHPAALGAILKSLIQTCLGPIEVPTIFCCEVVPSNGDDGWGPVKLPQTPLMETCPVTILKEKEMFTFRPQFISWQSLSKCSFSIRLQQTVFIVISAA